MLQLSSSASQLSRRPTLVRVRCSVSAHWQYSDTRFTSVVPAGMVIMKYGSVTKFTTVGSALGGAAAYTSSPLSAGSCASGALAVTACLAASSAQPCVVASVDSTPHKTPVSTTARMRATMLPQLRLSASEEPVLYLLYVRPPVPKLPILVPPCRCTSSAVISLYTRCIVVAACAGLCQ